MEGTIDTPSTPGRPTPAPGWSGNPGNGTTPANGTRAPREVTREAAGPHTGEPLPQPANSGARVPWPGAHGPHGAGSASEWSDDPAHAAPVAGRPAAPHLTFQEDLSRFARNTRDEARGLIQRRREWLAERLSGVADSLRLAGERLDAEVAAGLGDGPQSAASQVDRASTYVRDADLRDIARDAESFARRRPALFLLGTCAAGFLAARAIRHRRT